MNNMTDTDLELLRKELDSLGVSHSKKKELERKVDEVERKLDNFNTFLDVISILKDFTVAFLIGFLIYIFFVA